MASFLRDAAATAASYIPGRSRPGYEPVLAEDGDVEPAQEAVAEEEAATTAKQKAAKIILSIVLICLTFLLVLAAVFV